jgi:hypothetical protein
MNTCPERGAQYARTHPKHWVGVTAEDIPQGWMDDMIKRLFDILNRDMIRLESAQIMESDAKGPDRKPPILDLETAARKSRLAAQMQRQLERLTEMELKRVPARKQARRKKAAIDNDDSLEELERRIDRIAAEKGTPEDPGQAQS